MRNIPFVVLILITACGGSSSEGTQAQAAEPLAAIPPAAPITTDPSPETVLATWKGGQVTYGEIHREIGTNLQSMHVKYLLERYETQAQMLDQLVDKALLEAEADRRGFDDVETLLGKEIEEKTPTPKKKEVEEFYPLVARQLQGAPLEAVYGDLEAELRQRAMAERYRGYIGDLRDKANVARTFPYPDMPRTKIPIESHDPRLGDENAPVQIVQFAEYECFYCNKVTPTLDKLLETYDGKVSLVFKDFPLAFHANAMPAAAAAHCADEQGKYWEMNKLLLANQGALAAPHLASYAQQVGLDVARWDECVASGRHQETVQADIELAKQIGVEATPTFFINGIQLSGAQPYERFAAVIDRELAQ